MEKKGSILTHCYELGRMVEQGTFAKFYHAKHITSSQTMAIKIIEKEKVQQVVLIDQIKREISVMRLVRHPNIIQLYEVMASKTDIYFIMEYIKGGELFNKVAKREAQGGRRQQVFPAADRGCGLLPQPWCLPPRP